MLLAGDVIYCPQHVLPNGVLHNTWFVLLNDGGMTKPILCLMSTSQEHRYRTASEGCNHRLNCYHIKSNKQKCFTHDSYLLLPWIKSFDFKQIARMKNEGKIEDRGKVDQECLLDILRCLSHYHDDIDADYYEMLFY